MIAPQRHRTTHLAEDRKIFEALDVLAEIDGELSGEIVERAFRAGLIIASPHGGNRLELVQFKARPPHPHNKVRRERR